MTTTPLAAVPPAPLPSAAVYAAAGADLAAKLVDRASGATYGDGFAALTHGLLAVAAALQASGGDTGDALADLASHLPGIGLEAQLADLGGTRGPRLRRRPWGRRQARAAAAGGCP
ncbi:MAG TPA: hypothetical protein VGM53_35510 [Streptosporangiaceae bacterium]|jgi:hypothetical protein